MMLQQKQPKIYHLLLKAYQTNRLSHAYLFSGVSGSGKHAMATWLAKTIFCLSPTEFGSCDACQHCQRINNGDFIDVDVVEPDGLTLKIDQIRQLRQDSQYTSIENGKKVYIIDKVETMSSGAANSLLKFLEEPHSEIYFILLTTHKEKVLDTIKSRCQLLSFQTLSKKVFQEQLIEHGIVDKSMLYSLLTNNIDQAVSWSNAPEWQQLMEMIDKWAVLLMKKDFYAFIMVQTVLMSVINQKEWAMLGLDLLALYGKDLIMLQAGHNDGLVFVHHKKVYEQSDVRGDRLLSLVVEMKNRLDQFIVPQVCYENLCIEILKR